MFFSTTCEGIDEIYEELEKFTGTKDDLHDDIVSALSLLAEQFGMYADMEKATTSLAMPSVDRVSKARHDQIYGGSQMPEGRLSVSYAELALQGDDNPTTVWQLERMSANKNYSPEPDIDPLADLF